MRFLLDTDAISDLIRNPQGRCAGHLANVGESDVCTSIIVAAELRYGATRRRSPKLSRRVEAVLSLLRVVPFESPADAIYSRERTALETAGTQIGGNDLLIASHALALGTILVTGNERELRRVPGLKVENWLLLS